MYSPTHSSNSSVTSASNANFCYSFPTTPSTPLPVAKHAQVHVPSGPRSAGEGVENQVQEVLEMSQVPGGTRIRVTLLASGFIIGPEGCSILEISSATGAEISSHTLKQSPIPGFRSCREFCVQGTEDAISRAVSIICAAVERYKFMCEGSCRGKFVAREQNVCGIKFVYQPPPRSAMPQAARVRDSPTRGPRSKNKCPRSTPLAPFLGINSPSSNIPTPSSSSSCASSRRSSFDSVSPLNTATTKNVNLSVTAPPYTPTDNLSSAFALPPLPPSQFHIPSPEMQSSSLFNAFVLPSSMSPASPFAHMMAPVPPEPQQQAPLTAEAVNRVHLVQKLANALKTFERQQSDPLYNPFLEMRTDMDHRGLLSTFGRAQSADHTSSPSLFGSSMAAMNDDTMWESSVFPHFDTGLSPFAIDGL